MLIIAALSSAISVPVTASTLTIGGGIASAHTTITCTLIHGNVNKPTPPGVHIGRCSPSAGPGYAKALIDDYSMTQANLGNLDWNGGAVTTVSKITQSNFADGAGTICPAGTFYHVDSSGTVTAASSKGSGIPEVGDTVSWKVCVSTGGKLSLQSTPRSTCNR